MGGSVPLASVDDDLVGNRSNGHSGSGGRVDAAAVVVLLPLPLLLVVAVVVVVVIKKEGPVKFSCTKMVKEATAAMNAGIDGDLICVSSALSRRSNQSGTLLVSCRWW